MATNSKQPDSARTAFYATGTVILALAAWKIYQTGKEAKDAVADVLTGIPVTVNESLEGWESLITESSWERDLEPGQCNVVDGVRACRNFDGTLTRTTDIKPWWETQ